ncbi:leucyl aminopeptidase family protein [Virgibacillus kimchii]
MNQKATILNEGDKLIQEKASVKQYVECAAGDFCTLLIDEAFTVVVKGIKEKDQTGEKVRMLAGDIARTLGKNKVEAATVNATVLQELFPEINIDKAVTAFAEGWHLGQYQFSPYKSEKNHHHTVLHVTGDGGTDTLLEKGKIRAEATAFSRDLMNEIPSALNPSTFPGVLEEAFSGTDVQINVWDKKMLEQNEMNGVLTVGRGSIHEPAFVEMTYRGDDTKPLIALVGKGVTFDTGGISLKKGRDLSSMRHDMGGAAAVAGAMKLLSASKAKVNVVALIPIVENMPDSKSVIPGDVIRYKNGLHVQVGNTDAEGRLILADGLIRAGELQAEYVVDIATLTGAIIGALGTKLAGVFGDEQLSWEMKQIGDENGDFNWPMPLVDAYESYIASDYADFNNTTSKVEGASIVAGLFLRRFVPENVKWLHVDMAGRMRSEEGGYYATSATGFGARLLADFTEKVSK